MPLKVRYLASRKLLDHLRLNNLLHELPIVQRIGNQTIYVIADGYLGLPIYETNSLPCAVSELEKKVPNPIADEFECPLNSNNQSEDDLGTAKATVHLIRIPES